MKTSPGNRSQKRLWFLLSCGILLAALWEITPLTEGEDRLKQLPLQGPRFQAREVPLTETEKATFDKATVVKRLVRCTGQPPLLLTAIDGGRNQHAVHDPTYCLRGAGWEVVAENPLPITGGVARWIRMRQHTNGPDREIEAVYWYSNGSQRYASPLRSWKDSVLRRMTLGYACKSPVLFLVQTIGQEDGFPDWEQVRQDTPTLFSL